MEIHLLMYKEHRLLTEHSRKAEDNLLVSYVYVQLGSDFFRHCVMGYLKLLIR